MKITSAKNPKWSNASQTLIDCEIEHTQFGWIPFTASPDDVEATGRELFERLESGEFGPVAAPDFEDVPL